MRFSLSLAWGLVSLSFGEPEAADPRPPFMATPGDLLDAPSPAPFPLGFTAPSTRDPWEGWAEE